MAYTNVLTDVPAEIIAGNSVSWILSLSDYHAPSWVLTYALVKDGKKLAITGTDDGTDHLVELAASTTAAYAAGTYHYQAYVTNSTLSERYVVDSGTIEVLPNFATQTAGYDDRTHAKVALDAIEAVLENRATKDQEAYSIAGRSLSMTPISDLLQLRDYYRREYNQEQRKVANTSNQIKVRF